MFKFTVLAATFAALASAYVSPGTSQCTDGCNPIAKPGLNEVVSAGSAYTITWGPTTTGTVTIVLEKGPSTNIQPLYAIAEKIANTGTFTWTPATDLEPTGDSGYGLQIVNDADGTYQWSTQFGISNAGYVAGGASSSVSSAAASSLAPASSSAYGAPLSNGTISSAAATSVVAAPTGYSNATAAITSAALTTGASSTLSTASVTAATTASSSTPSNGAVAMGASVGGAFFALIAAAFAL